MSVIPNAAARPRRVVVTGASRGIGAAIARSFAAMGDEVYGLSRSGLAPEGVHCLRADVSERESLTAALTPLLGAGGVDVLVTAAGIAPQGLAARVSSEQWEAALGTNLTGTFLPIQCVLPGMMRSKQGRIIALSSVIASRGGVGLAAYGASKGGVEGLVRTLARELAPRGITVNAIAPGWIDTEMTAQLSAAARSAYIDAIPAGRFGTVEDVAKTAVFLASPGAAYITGASIPVDGGLGMGR